MENEGKYYLINHIALITGLTDRTIRKHISSGLLQGEKINGLWHFTPEQVESFITHPSVRPSILAKNHSAVYDFLLDNKKQSAEICIIADYPKASKKELAEYFCYHIYNDGVNDVCFRFDGIAPVPRIILKGNAAEVLRLINNYTLSANQHKD